MSSGLIVGSKDWANQILRYGIEILRKWWIKPNCARVTRVYKVVLVRDLIYDLREAGFWWQSNRLENHLHLFLQNLKDFDTLSIEREREASSIVVGEA